tara:strand:+ start:764 stop:1483 length:720 start_codon:yes stop_codon:yes gene_type:complete
VANWIKKNNKFISQSLKTPPGLKDLSLEDAQIRLLKSYYSQNESYYDSIIKHGPATEASLIISTSDIAVDANGAIGQIIIGYKGKISVESLMSSSYHIFMGKDKIIIILFGKDVALSNILAFRGNFNITSATIRNTEGTLVKSKIINQNIYEYNQSESLWSETDKEWDLVDSDNSAKNVPLRQRNTILDSQLTSAKYYRLKPAKADKAAKVAKTVIKNKIRQNQFKRKTKKGKGLNVAL